MGFSSVSETNSTTGRSFWCRVRRSRNKAEGMRAVGRNLRSEMRESQCLDTDLNWQRDLKGKNEKIWIKTSVQAATVSAGGGRVGWVAAAAGGGAAPFGGTHCVSGEYGNLRCNVVFIRLFA